MRGTVGHNDDEDGSSHQPTRGFPKVGPPGVVPPPFLIDTTELS